MAGPDRTTQAELLLERLAPIVPFALPPSDPRGDGSGLAGFPADRPDLHPDPDDLIVAVAVGLRSLHDVPVDSILTESEGHGETLPSGWDAVIARCRSAVADGPVDAKTLPEPYRRYTGEQLLAMAVEGRPDPLGDAEQLAVCHGAPTLDRFTVDAGRFSGFDRLDAAIVADRHLDLAVVHQSITAVFGPEAVFRFYESYGRDPDLPRLEHYVLVSHLTGAVRPAGESR